MAQDQALQRLLLQLLAGQLGGRGQDVEDTRGGMRPPMSLTDQLNQIGAQGDALTRRPGVNIDQVPKFAPFVGPPALPTPPVPPSVDLLGGRMIQTGGQPPPPSPQAAGPIGPALPTSPDMGQQDYPGSLPMRFPPPGPPPFPDAPLPPDSRLGAPPFDEQGGYSGGRLRFPGLPEEAPGELPAAPEKEGDLSRARATGELEKLYAMQQMAESLGGMEVVTTGDILHRTAKGVGPGRPRGQALKSYTDFLAKKELGGIGTKDAMALQGLKGTQALAEIEAKGKRDVKTALASRQDRLLPAGELSAVDAYHETRRVGKELLGMVDEMSGSLGTLDNALDNAGAFFGWQMGKTAEFRRMASDMLVRHIREMTGQQMSALEIKNLEKTMPTTKNTATMFKSKLEGVLRHIEERQEQWAETRRGAGYYIPESLGPVGGPGGTVKHKRTGETQEVDGATLERVRQTPGAWEIVPDAAPSTGADVLQRSGGTGIF